MKTTSQIEIAQADPSAFEGPALPAPAAERMPEKSPSAIAPPPPGSAASPPRGRLRRRLLAAAAVLLVGAAGWYGWHWWTVGRFMVGTDDAYVGAENAALSAKIAAHVAAVPVEANQRVAAGEPIVVLDDGDYRLALASAEAKLATQQATLARIDEQTGAARIGIDQARAQLDAAVADTGRTEADYERARDLFARQAGAKATLDTALAARDRARAMEANARSGLAAAEVNVKVLAAQRAEGARTAAELVVARDRAQRDLDFTVIRAPFDGVVANKAVQVGDYVTAGKRLAALVPIDRLYVDANFKETQIAGVKPGSIVHIRVDAFPGRDIRGTVASVAPGSGAVFSLLPPENATGNFTKIVQRVPVRIAVSPEVLREGVLRPGLSVVVDVDTRTSGNGPATDAMGTPVAPVTTLALRHPPTVPDDHTP